MESEKISIIVPIYKVEKELDRCVSSILQQTYRNLEIILVDDGSPDRCPVMCDEYARQDHRVKVIHKENGGLSDARNAGLQRAEGTYLAFVDSDDWVEPDFIETLYTNMVSENADISIVGYTMIWESGKIKRYTMDTTYLVLNQEQAIRQLMLQREFQCMACQKMYKTEIFQCIRFPVGKIYEDAAISLPTFLAAHKVVVTGKSKYFYWQRKNSTVNSAFQESKLYFLESGRAMIAYSDACGGKYDLEAHTFYLKALMMLILQAGASDKTEERVIHFLKNELSKEKKYLRNNPYLESRKRIVLVLLSQHFSLRLLSLIWKWYTKGC